MTPEAGAAPQRRAFSRVPLRAKVRMEFVEQRCFLSEWAVNLSPGGMFVRSEAPVAAGQRFEFEAGLSPGGPRFGGLGEVLWARREWEGAARPPGFAVRFVELDESGRHAIQRLGEVFLVSGVAAMQEELSALALAWQSTRLEDESTDEHDAVEEEEVLPDTAIIHPPWPEPGDDQEVPEEPRLETAAPPEPPEAPAVAVEPRPAADRRWPGWLAGLLVLLAAGGYVGWRRGVVPGTSRAGGGEAARASSGAAIVPATVAAALPAERPRQPLRAFESIRGVTWRESDEGLWVTLELDGEIPADGYRRFRAGAPPPREVLQLRGARRGYQHQEVTVGSPLLHQIRFGFHPGESGDELRVVLDLGSPAVSVHRVERAGSSLRVLLGEDAPAPLGRADLPAGSAQ